MIQTSDGWKALFTPQFDENGELLPESLLLPESNVRLICDDNVENISNWTKTAYPAEFSNTENIFPSAYKFNTDENKIATYEWNFWVLDGTFKIPEQNESEDRYVSQNLCNENCVFGGNDVYIILRPPTTIEQIDAVTIKFAPYLNEYATSIRIASDSVHPIFSIDELENRYVDIELDWQSKTYLQLYVYKWSMPYRRARISEFIVGLRMVFEKENLSKFNHERTVDMLTAQLPQNDCKFSVLDLQNEFDNNITDARYKKYLNDNSTFQVYYGYKINGLWEYIEVDRLKLSGVERPQNGIEANLTLESDIQRMTQTFPDDESAYNWTSYAQLIEFISTLSGINVTKTSGNFLNVEKERLSTYVKSALGNNYYSKKMKEWLQLVSAAINSIIVKKPNGFIELKCFLDDNNGYLDSTIVDSIYLDSCFSYPEIENISRLKEVKLTTANSNEHDYIFRHSSLLSTDGVVQNAENLIIPIMKYDATGGFGASEGIQDNYMDWIVIFMNMAKKIKVNCMINPAWEVGDLIAIQLKTTNWIKGYITNINIDYQGYTKGTVEILATYYVNS